MSEKNSEEHLAPIGDTTIDMEPQMQELALQPEKSQDVDRTEAEIQELPLQHERSEDVDRTEEEIQELPLQHEKSKDVDRREDEIQELPLQHEKSKDVDRMEDEVQVLPLQQKKSVDVDCMEDEVQILPLPQKKSQDVDRMEDEVQILPLPQKKSQDVDRMEAEIQELPLQPENSEDVDRNTPSPEIVWCSADDPHMSEKEMCEDERRKRALNDIKELQTELLCYGDPEEHDLGPYGCNTVDMIAKFQELRSQLEKADEMDRLKRFLFSRLHESGWINRQQERIDVAAIELGPKMKYFELLNAVQDAGIDGIPFSIKEDFFEECEKIQISPEKWKRIFRAKAKQ